MATTKRKRTAFEIPFHNHRTAGKSTKSRKFLTTEEVTAGALAHLLAPRKHMNPDEIVGATVDCSDPARPRWVEHTKSGRALASWLSAEPVYVDIALGGLRSVEIAIRLIEAPVYAGAALADLPDVDDPDAIEYEAASLSELTAEEQEEEQDDDGDSSGGDDER